MPRKPKTATEVQTALPSIPKELIDQFVKGPMTADAVHEYLHKFLLAYHADYFSPSIESLFAHVFAEENPNWPVDESENLLVEYMK